MQKEFLVNIKGDKGDKGDANTLSIGTVVTGATGTAASASLTGTAPSQTLNLVLPRGEKGETGAGTDWNTLANRPATFPPSVHTHTTAQVTGLDTLLASKAAKAHVHTSDDLVGMEDYFSGKSQIIVSATEANLPSGSFGGQLGWVANTQSLMNWTGAEWSRIGSPAAAATPTVASGGVWSGSPVCKKVNGQVSISFAVQRTSAVGVGTLIASLPVGFRPSATWMASAFSESGGAGGSSAILPDGSVLLYEFTGTGRFRVSASFPEA